MTINVKSIVSLCMKMDLVPICMSERNLQNHILSTIPPQNQDEYNFFDNDTIITTFQDMKTAQNILYEDLTTDPRLKFHEFILLLGRMAVFSQSTLPSVRERVEYFFIHKLLFKKTPIRNNFQYETYWHHVLEFRA